MILAFRVVRLPIHRRHENGRSGSTSEPFCESSVDPAAGVQERPKEKGRECPCGSKWAAGCMPVTSLEAAGGTSGCQYRRYEARDSSKPWEPLEVEQVRPDVALVHVTEPLLTRSP
jgi:hypothetical protein